jgi:hypothetical protein
MPCALRHQKALESIRTDWKSLEPIRNHWKSSDKLHFLLMVGKQKKKPLNQHFHTETAAF